MSYSNILVAVAVTPESQQLLAKRYLSRASKGTHQFNYSRFRPGNVQSISRADA